MLDPGAGRRHHGSRSPGLLPSMHPPGGMETSGTVLCDCEARSTRGRGSHAEDRGPGCLRLAQLRWRGRGGGLGGSNATSTPVFRVLSRPGQAKTSRGRPRWTVCSCHLSFVPPTNKLYLGSLKTRLLKSQSAQFFQIKVSVLKTITFVCLF